ncbi:MAG TPA: response regulator [Casimicrobiaceae bacterium]|nr:response regulator [Casimicrobiaceae bacterium]
MARRLIIVEDDASTRRALIRWAKAAGYQAVAFASSQAFLACEIHTTDACLVLDLGLPGMTGAALKRKLVGEHRDLPTVFITALASPETTQLLRGLEGIPVLRKPFDAEDLAAAIESAAA